MKAVKYFRKKLHLDDVVLLGSKDGPEIMKITERKESKPVLAW